MIPLPDLAVAYELHVARVPWKRIARGMGIDWVVLKSAVEGVMRNGTRRYSSGYKAQPGRRPVYPLALIRNAHTLRQQGLGWAKVAEALNADPQKLRTAHQYAVRKGLVVDQRQKGNVGRSRRSAS